MNHFSVNPFIFSAQSKIKKTGSNAKGKYIIFDDCLFYPQGGGQASDKGYFIFDDKKVLINDVRKEENEILHYYESDLNTDELIPSSSVFLEVNKEGRINNSKYHTASHLIHNTIEDILHPGTKTIKSDSINTHAAYIKFNSLVDASLNEINDTIKSIIKQNIFMSISHWDYDDFVKKFYFLPEIYKKEPLRITRIGDFMPIACGGTHILSLKELEGLEVTKIRGETIFYTFV
jgi:alanyl-tRNA synthetase